MNEKSNKLRLIAGGFILAMVFHLCVQCEKYLNTNGDDIQDDTIILDVEGMENGGDAAEVAFLSGDPNQVIELLSEDSKAYYEEQLKTISLTILTGLGEALKNRELTVKSSTYAEFEFSDQGISYSIALGLDEDHSWKLIRF